MTKPIEIERKEWSARKTARELRRALRDAGAARRWLSVADASAISGVPMHLAKPGMMMLAGDASARLSSTDDGTLLFWLEDLTEHRRDWVPPQVRYVARRIHGVVDGVARISVAFLAVTLVGSSLIGVSLMLPTLPFFLDSIIQGLVISAASLMIGIPFLLSFLGLFGILASFGANILLGLIVSPIMIWAYYKVGLALMTLFNRVAPWFGALTDLGERAVGELDDEVLFTQLARANRGV